MKKVENLIEYAHIYTDEDFGKEHLESIAIAKKIENRLDGEGVTHARCILIDNYNPQEHLLNPEYFIKKLTQNQMKPDMVMMESTMTIYAIFLLAKMKNKLRKKYMRYIKSREKMPCSLLLAIWHVIKLGHLEIYFDDAIFYGEPVIAERLTVVLPKKYKKVERLGRKIIDSCNLPPINNKIEHIYF